MHLLVVGVCGNANHGCGGEVCGFGTLTTAGLEIGHLLNDVVGRKPGEAGILGTAHAVGQMAIAAGVDVRLTAVSNDVGHRRVAGGMPIRRL